MGEIQASFQLLVDGVPIRAIELVGRLQQHHLVLILGNLLALKKNFERRAVFVCQLARLSTVTWNRRRRRSLNEYRGLGLRQRVKEAIILEQIFGSNHQGNKECG